jgi:hypothetical protein
MPESPGKCKNRQKYVYSFSNNPRILGSYVQVVWSSNPRISMPNIAQNKSEFAELARIVNQFNTEAVQLRVLELLLNGENFSGGHAAHNGDGAAGHSKDGKVALLAKPAKAHRKRKMGALSAVEALIDNGYFKGRRSISEVADQTKSKLSLKFETNELSGPLARLVQQGKLKRDKAKTGFYQYFV